jgi:hypothetical protein
MLMFSVTEKHQDVVLTVEPGLASSGLLEFEGFASH